MRLFLSVLVVSVSFVLAGQYAGRSAVAVAAVEPAMELLIFEHPQCSYCEVFRRDVLPKYRIAARVSAPPLRFIDLTKDDVDNLGLSSRITVVPTAVVVREGREAGRIEGYWGSANFLRMLAYILDGAG
jgi:thioredoxin-related protein